MLSVVVSYIEGELVVLKNKRRQVANHLGCREVERRDNLDSIQVADVDAGEIFCIDEGSRPVDSDLIVRVIG